MEHSKLRPVARYKNRRFKSEGAFQKWLKLTATRTVEFEDFGQDLQRIWIDERGEIIHCNAQSGVWNGMFLSIEQIAAGRPAWFYFKNEKVWKKMDFIIEDTEILVGEEVPA